VDARISRRFTANSCHFPLRLTLSTESADISVHFQISNPDSRLTYISVRPYRSTDITLQIDISVYLVTHYMAGVTPCFIVTFILYPVLVFKVLRLSLKPG